MSSGSKSGASLNESTSPGYPKGWCAATVGDTGAYINGFAFKPSHREPDGRPIIRIQNLTDPDKPLNRTALSVPAAYHVATGEMLVSWSATVDVFVWNREPALVNQHIFRVVPDEAVVDKTFLFHWLKVAIDQLLDSEHLHGSTMKHINRGPFMAHEIPLPPRSEQARIAQKLEELLSDLDAGVAELKAAQRKLAQYRQSLLKAAVEGALTADWRARTQTDGPYESGAELLQRILTERRARWEASQLARFAEQGKTPPNGWQAKYKEPMAPDTTNLPALPDGWAWSSVEQLGEVQLGRQRSPDKMKGLCPVKYIRAANITEHGIDFDDVLEMDFSASEVATFKLNAGDVLLTEASGSPQHVGRPVVWPEAEGVYCFQNTVIRFVPRGVKSNYAFFIFQAWQKLGIFQKLSGGVGINHLSAGKFSNVAVPLPPSVEQNALVDAVEAAIVLVNQQELAIEHSLKQSAAQQKNILKAAFAGQLVTQDPNDEPAIVLLERIRAERALRVRKPNVRQTKQKKEVAAMADKLVVVLAEAGDWISAQDAFRRCGVSDGAGTDEIEILYAELRALEKAGRLAVEAVTDEQGRKLYDRLKLLGI